MRVSHPIALIAVALLGIVKVAACRDGGRPEAPPTARVVGYFAGWGIYGRDYQVKDVETSGAASRLSPTRCAAAGRRHRRRLAPVTPVSGIALGNVVSNGTALGWTRPSCTPCLGSTVSSHQSAATRIRLPGKDSRW